MGRTVVLEVRIEQRLSPSFVLDVKFTTNARRLGVFGPSGAGKTSLLNAIAGLWRPGPALVRCGDSVWLDTAADVHVPLERRRVGYMTQEPLLFPHKTVEHNLRYSPAAANAGRRFDVVVDVLGLGPLLARAPRTLSGGEQNRVALGRALLSDPALLMLDEPFAGLDATARRTAMALLDRVHATFEVPWIIVSHRDADLVVLADEVVVLDGGRVVAQDTPLTCLTAYAPNPLAVAHDVDNLLRGPVSAKGEDAALAELWWGGQLLTVPAPAGSAGETTYGCYANSLVLSLAEPQGQSARNHVPARVEALHPFGTECLVDLRVDGQTLRALVLASTVAGWKLQAGRSLWVNIKATSLTPLA